MANKASKPVVAGPDAAVIAALATNPAALAAYMGTFSAQSAPQQSAKVGPKVDLSAVGAAVASGTGEFRPNKNGNGGHYLVVKFEFNGKPRCLNVGGF